VTTRILIEFPDGEPAEPRGSMLRRALLALGLVLAWAAGYALGVSDACDEAMRSHVGGGAAELRQAGFDAGFKAGHAFIERQQAKGIGK